MPELPALGTRCRRPAKRLTPTAPLARSPARANAGVTSLSLPPPNSRGGRGGLTLPRHHPSRGGWARRRARAPGRTGRQTGHVAQPCRARPLPADPDTRNPEAGPRPSPAHRLRAARRRGPSTRSRRPGGRRSPGGGALPAGGVAAALPGRLGPLVAATPAAASAVTPLRLGSPRRAPPPSPGAATRWCRPCPPSRPRDGAAREGRGGGRRARGGYGAAGRLRRALRGRGSGGRQRRRRGFPAMRPCSRSLRARRAPRPPCAEGRRG